MVQHSEVKKKDRFSSSSIEWDLIEEADRNMAAKDVLHRTEPVFPP